MGFLTKYFGRHKSAETSHPIDLAETVQDDEARLAEALAKQTYERMRDESPLPPQPSVAPPQKK